MARENKRPSWRNRKAGLGREVGGRKRERVAEAGATATWPFGPLIVLT